MENYSLLMGASGDEDGGGVDGGAFRGTSSRRRRTDSVPDLGFAMAAALKVSRTSSDQWLSSICGLAHAMAEVVLVSGGSTNATSRSARLAVIPSYGEARRRGRARPSRSTRKEVSTSAEQPEHTPCTPALRDLQLLRQRPGEHLHSFTQRFTDLCLRLPQVSEAQVVDVFRYGTTNLQMIE
ncbi:hypothetical protein QYE76_015941 [Lolium multiflorum]|uniref:Retrotransposon gag domain-containing protein n=1 Tax=Lolium multiflorum TaxID=4521 RepID=A0AAD8XA96_LOLMU|nr:hypothetical protein QYE76_015941 [Lolium multiflorum]